MRLIVCEKQLAAKRIAEILSHGELVEKKHDKISFYELGDDFVIGLSGHVINIDFPEKHSSWSIKTLKSLVDSDFKVVEQREDIINALRMLADKVNEVIVSTDFDSEGELIGVEAVDLIKQVNPKVKVKRAVFSAITNSEINNSFNNLVKVDDNLADAAACRREIDLVWGAVLTRFISLVSRRLGKNFLSVGRVQTPVLSLIVDKEKERLAFKPVPYWELPLTLKKGGEQFLAHYVESKLFDKSLMKKILAVKTKNVIIKSVKKRESITNPPLPFDTTAYLREASRFGISAKRAMVIAEALYLKGYTSYPRTDNQTYPKSIDLKKILKDLSKSEYGSYIKKLKDPKPTAGKSTKDHPPIHPTGVVPKGLKGMDERVYDLIVRRFLATLSTPSTEKLVSVKLDYSGYVFLCRGLKIIDKGWREVYPFSKLNENLLPELIEGESVPVVKLDSVEKQTQPPKRYGHGSIIKVMSDLGLGTKATRPDIIQKLIDRFYISLKFVPGHVAFAVIDSLKNYASRITDPLMTSELDNNMELIAAGEKDKDKIVNSSRELLQSLLDQLLPNKDSIGESIKEAIRKSKVVGPCPKCGSDLVIRISRRTRKRFIGCSGYPNCSNGFPLPQMGFVQVTPEVCDCKMHKIILIRKGKRPFIFCPNLDCETKKAEEAKWKAAKEAKEKAKQAKKKKS